MLRDASTTGPFLAGRGKSPPAVFSTSVKREVYLVRVRAYGWWHIVESNDAHARFLAISGELYAICSFLRTRDERHFTNDEL